MSGELEIYAEYVTEVKFSEVDSLKIVWHGHYIRYFEDAREAFGRKYGIGYLDIYDQGYSIPLVDVSCQYKRPLKYGDVIRIRCTLLNTAAAKIIFKYQIWKTDSDDLIAEGKTTQVFLDLNGELQLYAPEYFINWKNKMQL